MKIDEKDMAVFWWKQVGENLAEDKSAEIGSASYEIIIEAFVRGFRAARILFGRTEEEDE